MTSLKRDDNYVAVGGGVSSSDLSTVLPFQINSLTSNLTFDVFSGNTSITPATYLPRDANGVRVAAGISSTDSTKLIPIYINPSTGGMLIE